jgi:hypothetical protein
MACCLGTSVQAQDGGFEPHDVEICPPASEVRDPEIDVASRRVAFSDAKNRLKVARLRADATLGFRGCRGTIIDTNLTISLPGITFKNGAEWGRSQNGLELFYARLGSSGQPLLARARMSGWTWTTGLLPGGENRQFPVATTNPADETPLLFYWRLNEDLSSTTLWREDPDLPATEQEFPGFVGPDTGGAPRWVPGMRAITTAVPDAEGTVQAALYLVDSDVTEVLTTDAGDKDEIWMWQAPEFDNDWVIATVVDGCCVRIYRESEGTWTLVHSFAAADHSAFGLIYSPEPFIYGGHSYLAMQFALTQRYGPSQIWIAAIDPAAPLYRKVSQEDTRVQIRNEPEWYADDNGAYVFYTHVTAGGFGLRRADTGL